MKLAIGASFIFLSNEKGSRSLAEIHSVKIIISQVYDAWEDIFVLKLRDECFTDYYSAFRCMIGAIVIAFHVADILLDDY